MLVKIVWYETLTEYVTYSRWFYINLLLISPWTIAITNIFIYEMAECQSKLDHIKLILINM
jgi:hypothetical protein